MLPRDVKKTEPFVTQVEPARHASVQHKISTVRSLAQSSSVHTDEKKGRNEKKKKRGKEKEERKRRRKEEEKKEEQERKKKKTSVRKERRARQSI